MNLQTLGYVFRYLREEKHLSIRDLADQVDIDYSYLSKIENGIVRIQKHQLYALLHFYHISLKDIDVNLPDFFTDLRSVLDANITHQENRVMLREKFIEKYEIYKGTKYLPYIHFVEIENIGYKTSKNKYFINLINSLRPELLTQPYRCFFLVRKLYWGCQTENAKLTETLIPQIEGMIKEVDDKYHPYIYYYLMTGYAFLKSSIKVSELYELAHTGLTKQHNNHFAMLTDITYGAYLVLMRQFESSITLNQSLLENPNYDLSIYSKEAVYYNIGEAYFQMFDYQLALENYLQSYQLLKQKSTAFYIAYCYYLLDEKQNALDIIDDAVPLADKNAMYEDLLIWFRRLITKKNEEYQIQRLDVIEKKHHLTIDQGLRVLLLKLRIDYYHKTNNFEMEVKYLREQLDIITDQLSNK